MNTIQLSSIDGISYRKTQSTIAFWVLGGYGTLLLVVIVFAWLIAGKQLDDVVKVYTIVTSSVGTLVGAIIGFYFQNHAKSKSSEED